jgi:hypothetical protein
MRKTTYFCDYESEEEWPDPGWLAPYFMTPSGRRRAFGLTNDCWGMNLEGIGGTEHLPPFHGRIDINLTILGHPDFGVHLSYQRFAAQGLTFYSKGDLGRLRECVRTMHGDLVPIGLYVPFETAWKEVKEFIERDGAVPKTITWIAGRDLPADTFPDPLQGARIRD